MGKKTKKEREEKRESFAAKRSKQKTKNMLITGGIFAVIAVIVGFSVIEFLNLDSSGLGAPPGAGTFGDEHEHASMLVRIFGDKFDFSAPAYQIKNTWIHFEGQDGTTVHRHSSGVTLGYLFETLGIAIDENCYIFPDGREFCNSDEYSIKYFINHQPVESINDHVPKDDVKILISYGDENQEQIDAQLSELDAQPVLG